MKTIEIIGKNRIETKSERVGCRGIVVKDGKVLLSNEKNIRQCEIPGGGSEPGETLEQCCVRELAEETGYLVKPERHYLTINERYGDIMWVNHYFVCRLDGKADRSLTDAEKQNGLIPEWVPVEKAAAVFGGFRTVERRELEGMYMRESMALKEYLADDLSGVRKTDLYARGQEDRECVYERRTARGAIVRGGEILMSLERAYGQYLFPGGGIEKGETPEECCAREIAEETGLTVRVGEPFAFVTEYSGDTRHLHSYYRCEVTGKSERRPTEREKRAAAEPVWIPIKELYGILEADTAKGDEGAENFFIHRREYYALRSLLGIV